MKRRIVKHGNSTLTVSIPSKWAKRLNLQAGDEISVEEKAKSLILTSETNAEKKEIVLDISSSDKFLKRCLYLPYFTGADKIIINFKDKKTLNLIQTWYSNLLGFEITEQTSSSCVLENVAKGIEDKFDKVFDRLMLLPLLMIESIVEMSSKNNFDELKNTADLEKEANKLSLFCRRMLNSGGYKNRKNATFLYSAVVSLEGMADDYRNICLYVISKKIDEISLPCLNFMKKILEANKIFHKLFYKFDIEALEKFKLIRPGLVQPNHLSAKKILDFQDSHELINKKEHFILSYLLVVLERMGQISEELFYPDKII